jgi:peptidoglycan/xylan/chitin deacetylase (PgdA/CDA1 family)
VAKPEGAPGKLTVVDWAGFKGAVTYTFDDGNSSQIQHYSELNALGVPFTFYLISSKSSASDPIWAQALKDGHELGNHSKAHAQVGTAADVEAASTFIQQKYGIKAWTLAAPYGDASYVSIAETSFLVNRGVANAIVKPNDTSKPFNLPCFIPGEGDPASAFNTQVDQAVTAGGWRIILVHGFAGGTDGAYLPVKIDDFVDSVKHTKSLGNVWIGTMVDVAAYWRGQAAVTKAVAAPAGTSTTYTWTLPVNFPPGKCLRVTAGGGTVSQGANVIPWNDHGFYEISLDAGTVTVSP